MKQDMLNSQIHLTIKTSTEGESLIEVSVHA